MRNVVAWIITVILSAAPPIQAADSGSRGRSAAPETIALPASPLMPSPAVMPSQLLAPTLLPIAPVITRQILPVPERALPTAPQTSLQALGAAALPVQRGDKGSIAKAQGLIDGLYTGARGHEGQSGEPEAAQYAGASRGTPALARHDTPEYFRRTAEAIWRGYFEKNVSAAGLPYDNVQWLETGEISQPEQWAFERLPDGGIRFAATSPTNIGYYLLAVAAARDFGWITEGDASARLKTTLGTLRTLERWNGHFYNFYDARDGVVTSRLASTVDSGNLAAALITVAGLFPEVAPQARAIAAEMDFSALYDRKKGLLNVAYDVERREAIAHYGDRMSEARLAYLVAISKGDIPRASLARLKREASLDGGAMDYLAPRIFFDEPGLDAAVGEQMRDIERIEGRPVWGKSESAYLEKDASGRWQHRYGRFGAGALASQRYAKLPAKSAPVVSPYSSFLALDAGADPERVRANLENLKALGLRQDNGLFLDGVQAEGPARRALPSAQVLANHQGMSLAALANHFGDGVLRRAFSADERIRAVLPLIGGRALSAPARRRRATISSRIVGLVESVSQAHWFGTSPLFGFMTHLGSGVLQAAGDLSRHVGDFIVNVFRPDPVTQEPWGHFVYLSEDQAQGGRKVWSAAYSPTHSAGPDHYSAEFWPGGATIRNLQNELQSETKTWTQGAAQIQEVTLTNRASRARSLNVTSFSDVALHSARAYWSHPAYQKLSIVTRRDAGTGALLAERRGHAAGETWPTAFYFTDGEDAGYETSRERFLGKGGYANPDALARGTLTGLTGAVIEPGAALQRAVALAPGQTVTVRFVAGLAENGAQALEQARRLKAFSSREWTRARAQARRAAVDDIRASGLSPSRHQELEAVRSQLLFPRPRPSGASRTLADLVPGARRDMPAIVYRLDSELELPRALELISLQSAWREKGTQADVVFVLGSADAAARARIARALEAGWTRVLPGWRKVKLEGFYIVDGTARTPQDRQDLENLAAALLPQAPVESGPALRRRTTVAAARPASSGPVFRLDDQSRELVIERPLDVPGVWSQIMANGQGRVKNGQVPADGGPQYALLMTQDGGGFAARWDAQGNRTTGFSADPARDVPGLAFHLRDRDTGRHLSLTPRPGRESAVEYRDRFGAEGYAVFESVDAEAGLRAELTAFVPPDDPLAVFIIDVENLSNGARSLDLTGLVDMALGEAPRQAQRGLALRADQATGAVLARNPRSNFPKAEAFFASVSARPSSHGLDRVELLGPAGELSAPAALDSPELSDAASAAGTPMAGLRVPFSGLARKGDRARVVLVLGQGKDEAETRALLEKYQRAGAAGADLSLADTRAYWKDFFSSQQVKTPDGHLDTMVNFWLARQAKASRLDARAGYHQASGAFGGRDQVQDSLIGLHLDPFLTRTQIQSVARHQFREGDIQHWWFEFRGKETGLGTRTLFSDDMLWLPYVLAQYVDATGDDSLLDEREPYLRSRELRPGERDRGFVPKLTEEKGTIYEHAATAIKRRLSKMGEHGLPLMGTGDWNDGMGDVGAKGKGESVWLAFFLYDVITRFIPVAERRGDAAFALRLRGEAARLKAAIAAHGWDGKWWLRAFYDDGTPLGSAANKQWMIDSLTQSWAVISGGGDPARNREALESAWRHLIDHENGIVRLGYPFFSDSPKPGDNHPGSLAGYPAGRREHGSYTHAAIWLAIAFAKNGDGDRAHEILSMLNPALRTATPEQLAQYMQEPNAVAADRDAAEPFLGRAGWTQYTGSAGWMFRAYTEYILGLRVEQGGLLIDPAIPTAWPGFTALKTLRHPVKTAAGLIEKQARYEIIVRNPDHVSKGVKMILLDGRPLPAGARVVPFLDDGKLHRVEVVLGAVAPQASAPSAAEELSTNSSREESVAKSLASLPVVARPFAAATAALPYWLGLYPDWVRWAYQLAPRATESVVKAVAARAAAARRRDMSEEDRLYLKGVLEQTWGYYRDYGGAESNGLIPDHIDAAGTNTVNAGEGREKGLAGDIVYSPTSPTNIGYQLLAVTVAAHSGLIDRADALIRLRRTLATLKRLPKWNGLLYNFYHTKTLVATDRFVSTVDNGNLAAALRTVGRVFGEVEGDTTALREAMDFRLLYDPRKGLLHNGYSPDAQKLSDFYYDMRVSEARTAYQEAIAKGDIPAEAWLRLRREVSARPSYSGTSMEFNTPLGNLNEGRLAPHSWGIQLKRFYESMMSAAKRAGLPFWGYSESGRLDQDDDGDWRYGYKAHGVPEFGPQYYEHTAPDNDVVAPYASIMTLSASNSPKAVVANLRALENSGVRGRYGFWEAAQVKADRSVVAVKQVMAHHQGMSLLALGNLLHDGFFERTYAEDPSIQKFVVPLINERPAPAPPAVEEAPTPAPAERFLGLGNRGFHAALRADGTMVSRGRGPLEGLTLERGSIVRVRDADGGGAWDVGATVGASYRPGVVELGAHHDGISAEGALVVDPEDPVELVEITLTNDGSRPRALIVDSPLRLGGRALGSQAFFQTTDGAARLLLAPGQRRTLRLAAGLATDAAVARRLKLRYGQPDAIAQSRLKARTQSERRVRFIGEMPLAEQARWESTLARLFLSARPAGVGVAAVLARHAVSSSPPRPERPALLHTIASLEDLPSALRLIQLSTLWREQGIVVDVIFTLELADFEQARKAELSLKGAWSRVLPGWKQAAIDGFHILTMSDLSADERAALKGL